MNYNFDHLQVITQQSPRNARHALKPLCPYAKYSFRFLMFSSITVDTQIHAIKKKTKHRDPFGGGVNEGQRGLVSYVVTWWGRGGKRE